MATFSQFKSKYITERRSKNIGDEGTKNIVKKLLGKDAIPDDGGKAGQARIERELGLNKTNTTTSNKNKNIVKKIDNTSRTVNFSSGASGTTPSGSVDLANTDKQFVQNRRTPIKTVSKTTSKLNLSDLPKPVNTDKFSDARKFQSMNQTIKDNQKNKVVDLFKNQNKTKTNTSKLNLQNTPKPEFKTTGKITNITKNKGVQLPNFVRGKESTTVLTQNQIQDRLNKIQDKANRNLINKQLKNIDTSDVDKLIPDKNVGKGTVVNPGNPKPNLKVKGAARSYRDFRNISKVVRKAAPKIGKVVRIAAPITAAINAKSNYDISRAQGMSKKRALGRTVARAGGQILGSIAGGALGGLGGGGVASAATGIAGGIAGYDIGGDLATRAYDTLSTRSGRRQLRKNFKQFRQDVASKFKK